MQSGSPIWVLAMTLAFTGFLPGLTPHAAGSYTGLSLTSSMDESPEVSELNSVCEQNDDCYAIQNAICDNSTKQCICKPTFSPASSIVCGRLFGDECYEGRCHADRTVCDPANNRCTCEFGLSPKPDNTSCFGNNFRNQLLYGDSCDHDENCTSLGMNMKCINKACVCKNNYAYSGLSCKEKVHELGAYCNDMLQVCYDDNAADTRICLAGKCACKHYYIPHNGTCKEKISLLGAPCNAKNQACFLDADGSEQKLHCQQGVCQCKDSFLLTAGKCKRKIETLGANCDYETDACYSSNDMNTNVRSCINGTCQCNNGFVSSRGFCLQKIGLLGASCNVSSQICFSNEEGDKQRMECNRGICQCKTEFVLQNGKCAKQGMGSSATIRISPLSWKYFISLTCFFNLAAAFVRIFL